MPALAPVLDALDRNLDASLKRLGTDRIDLLYLHHYDTRTPREETMPALEDIVRAGKALYPAVSNFYAWQTQHSLDLQEMRGWARLQAIQPMYNLVKRQAEVELLPMAQANGLSAFPYSPAAGSLRRSNSDPMTPGSAVSNSRAPNWSCCRKVRL